MLPSPKSHKAAEFQKSNLYMYTHMYILMFIYTHTDSSSGQVFPVESTAEGMTEAFQHLMNRYMYLIV